MQRLCLASWLQRRRAFEQWSTWAKAWGEKSQDVWALGAAVGVCLVRETGRRGVVLQNWKSHKRSGLTVVETCHRKKYFILGTVFFKLNSRVADGGYGCFLINDNQEAITNRRLKKFLTSHLPSAKLLREMDGKLGGEKKNNLMRIFTPEQTQEW